MATISSLGVGSGINAESIVTQLMSLERRPLTQISTKETAVNTKISAFGTLKGLLEKLRTTTDVLGSPNQLAAFKATSSSAALTATASSTATAGTYGINVERLATAHKLTHTTAIAGGSTAVINSGADQTFSLTVNGGTPTNLTVGTGATLGDLRNLINNSTAGVSANIISSVNGSTTESRLILTAKETGQPVTPSTTLSAFGSFHTVGGEQGKNALVGTTVFGSPSNIVGAGTFNVTAGTSSTAITIPASTSLNTLSGLINNAYAGVTASVIGNASDGYRLKLVENRTVHSVQSSTPLPSTQTYGQGSLALTVGGTTTNLDMPGNYTLDQIVSQINGLPGAPVTASIVSGPSGDTLKIESNSVGKPVSYTFSDSVTPGVSDGPLSDLNASTTSSTQSTTERAISYSVQDTNAGDGYDFTRLSGYTTFGTPLQNGQTAKLTIEGVAIESASNTISTSISGVTMNLKSTGDSTLTVERNMETTSKAVDDFVSAFNALNTQIRSYTAYDAANKKGNTLTGDSSTRSIQSQIQNILNTRSDSGSDLYSTLADLGISVGTTGNLSVNSGKLSDAIATDFASVSKVLDFYGSELYTKIGKMTASDGIISSKTESLKSMLTEYTRQKDSLELRLTAIEKRFRAQFSALDSMVGNMQTTSSFLTQQLAKF